MKLLTWYLSNDLIIQQQLYRPRPGLDLDFNEPEQKDLLTSIVGVLAAAVVSASLHCRLSAELHRRVATETTHRDAYREQPQQDKRGRKTDTVMMLKTGIKADFTYTLNRVVLLKLISCQCLSHVNLMSMSIS